MAKKDEKNENPVRVKARGFAGVAFLDTQFDETETAVMSAATYTELCRQFDGADIQILDESDETSEDNLNGR